MQNPQMAHMGGLNATQGAHVDGNAMLGQLSQTQPARLEEPANMNTYIYDYFIRIKNYRAARVMLETQMPLNKKDDSVKQSPNSRSINGLDPADDERNGLPEPDLPHDMCVGESFLQDWWCQFWDIFSASRGKGQQKAITYTAQARNLALLQNNERTRQVNMMTGAQYPNMRMVNGVNVNVNNMKRTAVMNNHNPNGVGPMANMNMKQQAMMQSAQMQRDNSGMGMNGHPPPSPGSAENAPSPNKRPRIEGGMNSTGMAGNHFELAQQGQNVQQQRNIEGMNPGAQGSPMQQGLDGSDVIFAGNPPARNGPMPTGPNGAQGSHALQDYQMQLMLLEQQNKKRLLMARQEQDTNQGPISAQGFQASMSPQRRSNPSPSPADMKRGTPKLNQSGLPGSPMPDVTMQQQRSSPAPGMGLNVEHMPPGMPPQFLAAGYGHMQQNNPAMRPPTSNFNMNGPQMTPQQMEIMRQNGGMPNGTQWRGPPMMSGQPPQMGGPMMSAQQRGQMAPPPAPPAELPRAQESPQQPAQAPPTPSQQNKANPKKKTTKDNKVNPVRSPFSKSTVDVNFRSPRRRKGQIQVQHQQQQLKILRQHQPRLLQSPPCTRTRSRRMASNPTWQHNPNQPPPQQGQPPLDNGAPPFGSLTEENAFGGIDFGNFVEGDAVLENFDFDSFIEDPNNSLDFQLNFGDEVQAGGDI